MFQNPMQILNLLQNNANPMAMMNQMFGNNPIFQQVMQMTQGKILIKFNKLLKTLLTKEA